MTVCVDKSPILGNINAGPTSWQTGRPAFREDGLAMVFPMRMGALFPIVHTIPHFRKCINYTFRKYQIAIASTSNCTLLHLCSSIAHCVTSWVTGVFVQNSGARW